MVTTVLQRVLLLELKKKIANVSTLLVYKQTHFSLQGWNSG